MAYDTVGWMLNGKSGKSGVRSQSPSPSHGVHQNGLHGVHGGLSLRLNGQFGLSLNHRASLARDRSQGGKIIWRNGFMIYVIYLT